MYNIETFQNKTRLTFCDYLFNLCAHSRQWIVPSRNKKCCRKIGVLSSAVQNDKFTIKSDKNGYPIISMRFSYVNSKCHLENFKS